MPILLPHIAKLPSPYAAHVSAEQLSVCCHNGRARPHNDEHGRKHEGLLRLLRANRQDAARGPGDGMQESVAMKQGEGRAGPRTR